jgi:hypothetical protein
VQGKKLTQDDYTISNKAMCVLLMNLGVIKPGTDPREVIALANKAIEAGDMIRTDKGYVATQQSIDRWDAHFKVRKQDA